MQADSHGPTQHKCHARPSKHAKQRAAKIKAGMKPKKKNRGRHLKGKTKGPVAVAKQAPVRTKPHRGKHRHGAKHPCA